MIDAQFSIGFELSDFKDTLPLILESIPTDFKGSNILKALRLDTPLGSIIAIANDEVLYLLEFVDRRGLEPEIERLRQKTKSTIIPGYTKPIKSIEKELELYFKGHLKEFKTPIFLLGSPFQKQVWTELVKTPSGETRSYSKLAIDIGKPSAVRAVAGANAANQLAIIIPCHRVINKNGELGGYSGGLPRKKWLIDHEKKKGPYEKQTKLK